MIIIIILFSFGKRHEHNHLQGKQKFGNSSVKNKIPSECDNPQLTL